MSNIKWVLLLLVLATGLLAQVSVISVTDEDKHTVKEDFAHTFEYFILPLDANSAQEVGKCQATRLTRRWFATAAHCVANTCKNGCRIQMDLLEQPVSALAEVKHTPQHPAVFIKPDFSMNIFAKNDLALIRLDLDNTPLIYYRRSVGKQKQKRISQKEFDQFLAQTPAARSALYHIKSPSFPPLLVFNSEANYLLKPKISVISIFGGKRVVKPNPYPVHYVKKLELAYTRNFGVRRGMSGSGVMSNSGEFVGIISGIFQVERVKSGQADKAKPEDEWFLFFAFNSSAVEFIKEVMGSDFYKLDIRDAYPDFVTKSRRNYSTIIQRLQLLYKQAGVSQ